MLRQREGADPACSPGLSDFGAISRNIVRDEGFSSAVSCDVSSYLFSDDRDGDKEGKEEGESGQLLGFSEARLLETLHSAALLFARAERYLLLPHLYKLIIAIQERVFPSLLCEIYLEASFF